MKTLQADKHYVLTPGANGDEKVPSERVLGPFDGYREAWLARSAWAFDHASVAERAEILTGAELAAEYGGRFGAVHAEMKIRRSLRKVVSARVAQANTAESDKLPKVMHIVGGVTDGQAWEVRWMSSDPMTAIDEVAQMGEEQFQGLLKRNGCANTARAG